MVSLDVWLPKRYVRFRAPRIIIISYLPLIGSLLHFLLFNLGNNNLPFFFYSWIKPLEWTHFGMAISSSNMIGAFDVLAVGFFVFLIQSLCVHLLPASNHQLSIDSHHIFCALAQSLHLYLFLIL